MSLLDQIPGLREAIARERFDRTAPFLGLPETVCGVECRPLTLLDVLRLDCIGSPFIVGGEVGPVDVGAFLKLQCTHRSSLGKWWMLCQLGKRVTLAQATEQIEAFRDDAFADSNGGGTDGPRYWTAANDWIHIFGKHYGWPVSETLNHPLKVLLPQLNVIRAEMNPSTPLFNPRSDKVRGQWLAEQNRN